MSAPLCKDCCWCRPSVEVPHKALYYAACACPHGRTKAEQLTGCDHEDSFWRCGTHREPGFIAARLFGFCGRSGRYFEPKENTR